MDIPESQNVHNLPVPNIEAMRDHLEHLFGGYLDGFHDGLIELAWTTTKPDSDGRYALKHATQYPTDKIEELVQKAAGLNALEHCNVYVGAALRKPGTFPGARASDSDFFALTCGYVDLDDEGATHTARDLYREAKPTKVVVTGRSPYTRAQCWWRFEEPIYDPRQAEAALKGMAAALGGDPTVTNPARVMRLAGSIAWPMKPGRQVEQTYIAPLKEPGQAEYDVNHLAKLFPPVSGVHVDGINVTGNAVRETTVFGFDGRVTDLRDAYLLKTVEAILIELIGETGKCPSGRELYDRVWPQYDRHVDPNKPRKREDYVARKCVYTIRRFLEGKIRGLASVEVALESYRRKRAEFKVDEPKTDPGQPLILTGTEFLKAFKPPDYLVDGVMQRSGLYAMTARTGHGKTAVAMYAALCVARGVPFHNKPTEQGSVLFFAGENSDDIRARYTVMLDIEKANVSDVPLYFIDGVINIQADMERIRADAAAIPNLSMVIIDTKQAYFSGDDGNSNEQQVQFARLGRELIKLPGQPAVVFLCHPIKNAGRDNLVPMGGSAFLNEIDFNFTLWADDRVCKLNPHPDKWRGPPFEEMAFDLKQQVSTRLKDSKDREIPSVVAVPITEMGAERRDAVASEDEKQIMRLIHADKNASFTKLAERAGWKQPNGELAKSKVARVVARLHDGKMVYRYFGNKYRLTKKGSKHIGVSYKDDDEE